MITIRIVPDIIAKIIIISKIVNMVIITNMTRIDDEAVRNVLKVLFDKSLSPPLKLHLLLHIAHRRYHHPYHHRYHHCYHHENHCHNRLQHYHHFNGGCDCGIP